MDSFIEYVVPPEDDGQAVKTLLKQRLQVSTGLLGRLKRLPQGITLDGERVTVRALAREGQVLRILADTGRGTPPLAVAGELNIVHETEDMLILNKPAGLVVHPSRGHYTDTLANRVAHYLGSSVAFRAINRLDGGTSGLMCAAKSAYAAQMLARQLYSGEMEREYLAVVEGVGLPESGVIDAPIARVPGRGIMREVREDGQRAVTRYWRIAEGAGRSLVRVVPETGRTHQIRVHFAHLGASVAGDFMYGRELEGLRGHALHSARLRLKCPRTGAEMDFSAPSPEYFGQLLGGEM